MVTDKIKYLIKNKRFLIIVLIISLLGCAKQDIDLSIDDINERYNKGLELLKKRKYYRSQEHFQYVLLRGRHTDIGDDAQFHLAEAYYLNKEYDTAISEFDKLIRQMSFSPHVRLARYRICQSYEKSSPKFYFDQDATIRAIQKYQEFVEDFPDSEYRPEATATIQDLRNKLSKKIFFELFVFKESLIFSKVFLSFCFETIIFEFSSEEVFSKIIPSIFFLFLGNQSR